MTSDSYLQWLVEQTPTLWWHDSGDPNELDWGLQHGASGVTTNPVLTSQALHAQPTYWRERGAALPEGQRGSAKVEALMHAVAIDAARKVEPRYRASQGAVGYVCAQVNPNQAGDRDAMLDMARRFHQWAPNIAVKLPVTAAGLDVLETCVA